MSDSLRKSVIEIDWKINNTTLQKANEETDRIIQKGSDMEKSFRDANPAIKDTAQNVSKSGTEFTKTTSEAKKFGSESKSSYATASNSAKGANNVIGQTDKVFDRAGKSSQSFSQRVKTSMNSAKSSVEGVTKKIDSLESKLTSASNTAWGALGKIKNAAVVGGTALVGASVAAFNYASDTNESLNKVEVAFGDNNKVVEDWSKTTLKNIGLAQGTALDLAATFGDMSTSMGISTNESAKMSTSMVDLAGDLASFKNLSIDRVYTALNGVFTGETEALKGLGIVMTQTNLEQYAMEKGMLSSNQTAGEAAKKAMAIEKAQNSLNKAVEKHGAESIEARDAQLKLSEAQEKANETATAALSTLKQDELVRLRYNYVMDKTKNSQGDFARTSDQAANATRILTEQVKETSSNIGQKLLPLFTPLIIKASDMVKQGEKIPDLLEDIGKKAEPSAKKLVKHFGEAKDFFVNEVIPTAKSVGDQFGPGFIDGAKATFDFLNNVFNDVVRPTLKTVKDFADDHPDQMKKIGKWSAIGVAGLLGFKAVGKPVFGVTKKVIELIGAIKGIGDATLGEAVKTKLGFSRISKNAESAVSQTVASASNGSLVDEAGELIAPTSTKRAAGRLTTFFGGSAASSFPVVENAQPSKLSVLKSGISAKFLSGTSKVASTAKGIGKAIPGVSLLAAGVNLIGTNKDNVGEKIGGSLGTIVGGALASKASAVAGAKLGAVAGTAFGPVGTAIGGILGTTIGLAVGSEAGKAIQKNWESITEWANNAPVLGTPVRLVNQGREAGKKFVKGAKEAIESAKEFKEDFFGDPLKETKIKAGKGVSKETARAVNNYMSDSNSLTSRQTELSITGRQITDAEYQEIMSTYDSMEKQVVSSLDQKKDKSAKNINKLLDLGVIDSGTADSAKRAGEELANVRSRTYQNGNEKIKALEEKQYQETQAVTNKHEAKINEIKAKAQAENRELTEKEQANIARIEAVANAERKTINQKYADEINGIKDKQNKDAVIAMSDSAKEQEIILGNLQMNTEKISAKQAADVVASSYKAKEGTIKAANEKYDETKRLLDEEFFVSKTISEDKYKEALRIAGEERDGTIKEAEKTHEGVVTQAKKQAEGHLEQVDWETGETLSKWDIFKKDSEKKFGEITEGAAKIWQAFSDGFVKIMSNATSSAISEWNQFKYDLSVPVNAVISGINAVLGFFGVKEIPKWVPQGNAAGGTTTQGKAIGSTSGSTLMNYKGSNGGYQGPSLVGEEGPELAYDKSRSRARILGSNGPEMTHIRSSEHILNHRDTMSVLNGGMGAGKVLPGFADGKGDQKELLETATDFVGAGIDKAKDIASTAMDWLSAPGEKVKALVDKHNKYKKEPTTSGFGWGTMTKIKDGAVEWVTDKLASVADFFSSSGGASGTGAYAPHFGSPFTRTSPYGPRPGLYGDFHTGIDYAAPLGTPLPAQYPGQVTYAGGATGYGNLVTIQVAKGIETLYGHMKSVSARVGQIVKPGETIAAVGSEGWSTGPHVHYEVRKDGKHVDPDTFGGTPVASPAGGWEAQIRSAAKQMKQQVSDAEVNGILAQIQRESSGNQSIIQSSAVWDVNTASGNPARGLLQYIPQTFNAYKVRGYENIMNGFHQLLAFFNNSNWRSDLPYGRSGWGPSGSRIVGYAKGGRPTKGETVLVGENGPELFEADTAGTVHPYEKTRGLFEKSMPQVNYSPTINITVEGSVDQSVPNKIKEVIQEALQQEYERLMAQFGLSG